MAKTRAQRKAERRAREASSAAAAAATRTTESRAQHDTQVPVSGDVAEIEAVEAGIAGRAPPRAELETPDAPKTDPRRSAAGRGREAQKEAEKRERDDQKRREREQLAKRQKQAAGASASAAASSASSPPAGPSSSRSSGPTATPWSRRPPSRSSSSPSLAAYLGALDAALQLPRSSRSSDPEQGTSRCIAGT